MKLIKILLRPLIKAYTRTASLVIVVLVNIFSRTFRGQLTQDSVLQHIWGKQTNFFHKGVNLNFVTPTALTKYRAVTFASKEPETLLWIEGIPEGSVLMDVGANVGIFSVYAALARNCKVYAIEPSLLNLDILLRNIVNNRVAKLVTVIPLALSDADAVQTMFMSRQGFTWGGAHNSIGKNIGQDGQPLDTPIESSQLSITIDSLISQFQLDDPNYLKIDVDGLELLVLKGASNALKKVDSILIEVDTLYPGQDQAITSALSGLGFNRRFKIGNINLAENQIWDRK